MTPPHEPSATTRPPPAGYTQGKHTEGFGPFDVFAATSPTSAHVELLVASGWATPEMQRPRLQDAIAAARKIDHPNVGKTHDMGFFDDGEPWIAREPVEGPRLSDVLRRSGPLTPLRAAHLGRQVALALDAAHKAGALHGALSALHVRFAHRFGAPDWVVVDGFGLWPVPEAAGAAAPHAPELHGSESQPDARSDLWSLGALVWTALTGKGPELDAQGQVCATPDEAQRIPTWLRPHLLALLSPDPATRPDAATIAELFEQDTLEGRSNTAEMLPAKTVTQAETAAQPLFFLLGGLVTALVVAAIGFIGGWWTEEELLQRPEPTPSGSHAPDDVQ